MKIVLTWTPFGATQPTSYVLADSPAHIPVTNFKINGTRLIQEAAFFRSNAKSFYDRGNRKTEITFDTTRSFPDQNTAETFVFMHETQFPSQTQNPGQFLVTLTAGPAGAGATTNRYLKNATLETVTSSLMGCTTKHSYKLTGGAMATSPS
jgi:hypothetical protein